MAEVIFIDNPRTTEPIEAIRKNRVIVFLAPHVSDNIPVGSCIMAYG